MLASPREPRLVIQNSVELEMTVVWSMFQVKAAAPGTDKIKKRRNPTKKVPTVKNKVFLESSRRFTFVPP